MCPPTLLHSCHCVLLPLHPLTLVLFHPPMPVSPTFLPLHALPLLHSHPYAILPLCHLTLLPLYPLTLHPLALLPAHSCTLLPLHLLTLLSLCHLTLAPSHHCTLLYPLTHVLSCSSSLNVLSIKSMRVQRCEGYKSTRPRGQVKTRFLRSSPLLSAKISNKFGYSM